MNRLRAILRSAAVRMSALYLVLFAACAAALVFYVTDLTGDVLTEQTRQAVRRELEVLDRLYRLGGVVRLVRQIDRRAREPGANLYTVSAPDGRILAGNVEWLQPGVLDRQGWTERPFFYRRFWQRSDVPDHAALAEVVFLANGMRILVGRDLGEPANFRAMVRQSLIMALGIMLAGALAIWFLVGRRALKRIDGVSEASRRIMAGDLDRRLPVSGSDDEFDRLSQSLNAMLERIASLDEGLRRVSDNIAHDLKTPLSRLRNRAEAALAGPRNVRAYRAALEETIEESDQLIRTFGALLMISRVEAGSAVAEINPVDLSQIAGDVAELYEPVAESAGMRLETAIEPGVIVSGNRELISQALTNLIDNAIKYGTGAGQPLIRVRVKRESGMAALSVEDSGPGIPENRRADAVNRFVRLDESRSMPGTGLGLSLVDAVARLHGGRLQLTDCIDPDCHERGGRGLCARMEFSA